jgi:hypothetical protein
MLAIEFSLIYNFLMDLVLAFPLIGGCMAVKKNEIIMEGIR